MNSYQKELEQMAQYSNNVFIADTARVLGKVFLADFVSIWYGAVLRADFDEIRIDERTNVQEGVIMHVDHGKPIHIGKDNVIGHGAIIHGAKIGDCNLIGMRATILNGAEIGNGCIIGAHALVTENMKIPDGSMVLGTPAKIVKTLPIDAVKNGVLLGVEEYISEMKKYIDIKI
jgi:carbonic anhydrase/acetyltransferase-like protein (isoleucine patch superfamily)